MKTTTQPFNTNSQDVDEIKASLSETIIRILEDKKLTVRQAHAVTKVSAADFSRIRNSDLGRFTIDRLVKILNRLAPELNISLTLNGPKTIKKQTT